jgi:hypothetical protein
MIRQDKYDNTQDLFYKRANPAHPASANRDSLNFLMFRI